MPAAVRNYGADDEILRGDDWVDYVVLEVAADGLDHTPDPEVDEDWQPFDPTGLTFTMELRRRRSSSGDPALEVTVDQVTVADIDDPPAEVAALPADTPVLKLSLDGEDTAEASGVYYYDLSDDTADTWQRGQFYLTDQVTL